MPQVRVQDALRLAQQHRDAGRFHEAETIYRAPRTLSISIPNLRLIYNPRAPATFLLKSHKRFGSSEATE